MTVTTTRDCKFATILRRDYLVIKTNVHRQKVCEVYTYFRDFRLLKNFERPVIEKILKYIT